MIASHAVLRGWTFVVLAALAAAAQPAPMDRHSSDSPGERGSNGEPSAQYPPSKSVSTRRTPDRPDYVRLVSPWSAEVQANQDGEWLEFGVEQRTRFEIRDDSYRAGLQSDERFALRSRVFVGAREVLDPLRFGFEFQDSRLFGDEFPQTTLDVDEADILQLFGELYFKSAFDGRMPLSVRAGRMSFDVVDRRLVARNRFRNATQAFDGFRVRAGDETTPLEIEAFAMQPVERRLSRPDRTNEEIWLYGLAGYCREWSPYLTLEPYYLILDSDLKNPLLRDRELHTIGLHAFGQVGQTPFDYDVTVAFQFGETGDLDHRAFAAHAELGYSFDHDWSPRLAAWLNYASGDRDPADLRTQRFDPLFGASFMFYGVSQITNWQNTISPTLHVGLRPQRIEIDAFYRAYWLADDSDTLGRSLRTDPTGRSGDFVGQAVEFRLRYRLTEYLELDTGYSHFMPGEFLENTGAADDSDFFFVQVIARL